jgi:glycosyltransferase involved in cell wall biosynthesis
MLHQRNVAYRLIVVGSVSSAIKELCSNLNVSLVGHIPQDDLKGYLARSDIFLFPSLSEGCASSGLEAMSAGLPVISTFESGLPIVHGETGLIVPIKDSVSIMNTILYLLDDPLLRERIGKNASSLIRKSYSWDSYAQSVYKLYAEVCGL